MREVGRVEVIREVLGRRLRQGEASERLGICVRQVKRLVRRYREEGARGLRSRRRGRRASNAIAPELRREIVGVVRERYEDFAPTLAWEKLTEVHGYGVSVETLRKWMVAEGLWRSKKRPGARVHQSRPRRPALGELVQIDGSPHAWFEDRGRRCTLIVFIDDATSRLMALRFAEAETTEAYMRTLRGYLDQHGRPVAIYSDKHSIFRVNQKDREGDLTQFTRMLKTLDIQPIHANTPQAKGRVERANQTLQDRLVKELRLRRIDDIQSANAFLPEFIADYNQRFSVAPKPPRTPTATCSMTRPPSTSSSPSIPPESSAAISPAVTAAASTRSKARAAATASVAPPSPSVKASTAPSPSCAKARPSTTECSLKARRPSPQTTKKASAVPSTRPAPSSVNALATNPPQTTPGIAGLASTQPLPPLPHSHPRLVPL